MYTVASPDPNPRGGGQLPNPNECNSTLTSGTNNIYPYPYININDRGHRLRITHTLCRLCFDPPWFYFPDRPDQVKQFTAIKMMFGLLRFPLIFFCSCRSKGANFA